MAMRALVFDVDGTLADTERDGHRPAFNAAFVAAGLPWHWGVELYGELVAVTGGKERMRAYARRYDPAFLARPDADEIIAVVHADKTARYVAHVSEGRIGLRPGVARLIAQAQAAGVRLAIATTTAPANVTVLLEQALGPDAVSWFDVIGAGDVVAAKKPAPDIYRWVVERLAIPAEQCLALEDSAVGLRAALAAGVPAVVTPSPYSAADDTTGALALVADLDAVSLSDLSALHDTVHPGAPVPSGPTH